MAPPRRPLRQKRQQPRRRRRRGVTASPPPPADGQVRCVLNRARRCAWYLNGVKITLPQLRRQVSKADIEAAKAAALSPSAPPSLPIPAPPSTEPQPQPQPSVKEALLVADYLAKLLAESKTKFSWPSDMSQQEKDSPLSTFEPYRQLFMLYMVHQWLPQQGHNKACPGSSLFTLHVSPSEVKPIAFVLDAVIQESFLVSKERRRCELFLPTLLVETGMGPALRSMVISLESKTITVLSQDTPDHLLRSLLTAYFSQSAYLKDFKLLLQEPSVNILDEDASAMYVLLHNVLTVLCPSCDVDAAFLQYDVRDRLSILVTFALQAWKQVDSIGLLKRGAPLSQSATTAYQRQLDRLQKSIQAASSDAGRQFYKKKYWALVSERQKVEDWALSLVLGKGGVPEDVVDAVVFPPGGASVLPEPGAPPMPITPLLSPVEFLNILLDRGRKGCDWPKNMTVDQLKDPYRQFTYYREFYMRYMVQKELPALGYTQGCAPGKKLPEINVVFGDEQTWEVLDITPAVTKLEKQYKKQLQRDKNCSLAVVDLGWYLKSGDAHAMSVIIDSNRQTIEYMEPNGSEPDWVEPLSTTLRQYFRGSELFQLFTFIPPLAACPVRIQFGPYCAHYSILYNWLRIACSKCDATAISKAFSRYSKEENLLILNAFTCHMWQVVDKIGLLQSFRGVEQPLSLENWKRLLAEFNRNVPGYNQGKLAAKLRLEDIKRQIKAIREWAMNKVNSAKA